MANESIQEQTKEPTSKIFAQFRKEPHRLVYIQFHDRIL